MIHQIEQLVGALREELQQYGEMLARLDEQQELVMRRVADRVLGTVAFVQAQSSVIADTRAKRIEAMREFCRAARISEDSSFSELIPVLPSSYQILAQALVNENNELLVRVQQRARQNHLLLTRTIESMQGIINSLTSHRHTPVYSGCGKVAAPPASSPALYEAVC